MKLVLYVLLAMSVLLMSCEKIKTAIIDEFNSEKAPAPTNNKVVAVSVNSVDENVISQETGAYIFYLLKSRQASFAAAKGSPGQYTLTLQGVSPSILACGGNEQKFSTSMNNLVFVNQWSQGILRPAALMLFASDATVDLLLTDPSYNVAQASLSFTATPQEPLREEFLKPTPSCLLLIEAQEEGF
ncbi:MAG: hypothetical protein FJZ63_00340 [Chlamydiae bacterium]|nr:hypothetical protein [Chlamydiota bacterium]